MADQGDTFARIVWILLVMVLVFSALTARRLPLSRLLAWTTGWAALFLGIYLVFTLVEPWITSWQQDRRGGTVTLAPPTAAGNDAHVSVRSMADGSLEIPMANDGHFWVDASVNGQTVRFLIDSGASITALSEEVAGRLALPPDLMGATVIMQTANGPVNARRSVVPSMRIGTIQVQDLPVVVSPALGPINVLGMNFLNKLRSWRVEGGRMILEAG